MSKEYFAQKNFKVGVDGVDVVQFKDGELIKYKKKIGKKVKVLEMPAKEIAMLIEAGGYIETASERKVRRKKANLPDEKVVEKKEVKKSGDDEKGPEDK